MAQTMYFFVFNKILEIKYLGIFNQQQATGNKQRATGNKQRATGNGQPREERAQSLPLAEAHAWDVVRIVGAA
jgi:hypothetical protein